MTGDEEQDRCSQMTSVVMMQKGQVVETSRRRKIELQICQDASGSGSDKINSGWIFLYLRLPLCPARHCIAPQCQLAINVKLLLIYSTDRIHTQCPLNL